jgi:lysophospholipase L1-like esterase
MIRRANLTGRRNWSPAKTRDLFKRHTPHRSQECSTGNTLLHRGPLPSLEMIAPPRPWFLRALLATILGVALLAAKDWAYMPTFRLFLDDRATANPSTAVQQFSIEDDRVVPLIVTHAASRVPFVTTVGQDSTIHAGLLAAAPTAYAIEWRSGASHAVLGEGTVDGSKSIALAYPGGTGHLAFVSDGPLTWVDPRIVRGLPMSPYVWMAGLIALGGLAWIYRGPELQPPSFFAVTRVAWLQTALAAASLVFGILVSEAALRSLGEHVPSGLAAERHALGEVNRDPHWMDSPRYDRRLRPGVNTLNEWREGDIVRMGYIASPQIQGPLHRFSFQTDAEGFRNPAVRDHVEIAALGDSFTDAMTMAGEASWPARLESVLSVPVQNYGTAGFGPQQELLVLKDFVAPRRPRTVVLAFFAGNDIFDAEAFDAFQRSGGSAKRAQPGWRISSVISRAESWFVVSALRAGGRGLATRDTALTAAAPVSVPRIDVPDASAPAFDRGWFDLPVSGRRLRWAFMPPYLNTLNFSHQELAARPGWRLTRDAILEMQKVSHSFGAHFVVMFVPFKSQAYLPLAQAVMSKEDLAAAFGFYLERFGRTIDVEGMLANRLVQNQLMQQFCAEAGIPFLDTTATLTARAATGDNVYFPDESHLNELGEALIAETLAAFLKALQN